MSDSDSKVPVTIVTQIIDKVDAFTREIETLRGQLPDKDHLYTKLEGVDKNLTKLIGKMQTSLNSTLTTIKTIFILVMMVIGLAFIGARLINWYENKQNVSSMTAVTAEDIKKDIRAERNKDLQEIMDELHVLQKQLKMYDDEKKSND